MLKSPVCFGSKIFDLMKWVLVVLPILFISFVCSQTPAIQKQALIDLYDATNGPNWVNQWSLATDPCTLPRWFGVFCDASFNVIVIVLVENGLRGILPPSLTDLPLVGM